MKTYRHLYQEVVFFGNLYMAHLEAARGKRGHSDVAAFEFNLEDNLLQLQEELQAQTYRPAPYDSFRIADPKPRLISAADFRDRVVHHALVRVIEPLFERSFVPDSYESQSGPAPVASAVGGGGPAKYAGVGLVLTHPPRPAVEAGGRGKPCPYPLPTMRGAGGRPPNLFPSPRLWEEGEERRKGVRRFRSWL